MEGFIYKIVSPTGKVYIGQTIDTERRIKQYLKIGKSSKQPKLRDSILKYGWNNHIFKIIEKVSLEELSIREWFWVIQYNSFNKGLNASLPDPNGFYIVSDATKKRISNKLKGRKFTNEHCRNISKSKKGKQSWWKGKKRTKENIENISNALKGRVGTFKGKRHTNHSLQVMSESKIGENNPMYGKKQKRVKCDKCGKEVAVNVAKRWHFSNCKVV